MQYRVKATSFIGNSLREPGDIVTLPEGVKPGSNLEPVDEPKAEPKPKAEGKGEAPKG